MIKLSTFLRAFFLFTSINISIVLVGQTLEQQAQNKITILETLISEAEVLGHDVLREKLSVRTAEIFLTFADWDEQNVSINSEYFAKVAIYKNTAHEMAEDLADWERGDVILMLDASIATLQKVISKEYKRKPTPIVDWSQVSHQGDQLRYNGQPVFITDYTWKPEDADLEEFFGQQDGYYISPAHVLNKNGDLNQNQVGDLPGKASGYLGFIFINNKGVNDWAEEEYGPDFIMRDDTFTGYDIDNPGAKKMMGDLLAGTIPYMADNKYSELGYMLCNEPHFYTTTTGDKLDWASGPVSEHTFDKFRIWLEDKHQDIANLNALWETSFASFDAVQIVIPIDNALQGTPMWYDWTRFNNYRVTEWYTWLKSEIRKYDDDAKVHLKIMPNLWSNNKRGHGIDLEMLTELSEIIGNDAGAAYNKLWGPDHEWEANYAFEWREMCMSYDFLKSVSPEKLVYNTEAHYLSTGRSRDLFMNPLYARATFWLAHTQGLNASQIWYWPRDVDGSFRREPGKGYAGSNNQQPRVTKEVAETIMDLNSYSEEITTMQGQRKPIRIFYSETSAINDATYMDKVFELYEDLFFEGVPLGFTTQSIINTQDNGNWDVILIHETQNVTQSELEALQVYLDNGGTIIIDYVSLQKNEYGETLSGLNGGNVITVSTLEDFNTKAFEIVNAKRLMPDVFLNELNTSKSKSCTWKCVKNSAGNNVLSIINLGKTETSISIELKNPINGTKCINLLNGVEIANEVKLGKYEVLFIEVKDEKNETGISSNHLYDADMARLFPNPSSGYFTLEFYESQSNVELLITNMSGQVLHRDSINYTNQISKDLLNYPVGEYIVSVITGDKKQSFIYLKN